MSRLLLGFGLGRLRCIADHSDDAAGLPCGRLEIPTADGGEPREGRNSTTAYTGIHGHKKQRPIDVPASRAPSRSPSRLCPGTRSCTWKSSQGSGNESPDDGLAASKSFSPLCKVPPVLEMARCGSPGACANHKSAWLGLRLCARAAAETGLTLRSGALQTLRHFLGLLQFRSGRAPEEEARGDSSDGDGSVEVGSYAGDAVFHRAWACAVVKRNRAITIIRTKTDAKV
jgi:hypothetical protein